MLWQKKNRCLNILIQLDKECAYIENYKGKLAIMQTLVVHGLRAKIYSKHTMHLIPQICQN